MNNFIDQIVKNICIDILKVVLVKDKTEGKRL
jgi:hypothetical protein